MRIDQTSVQEAEDLILTGCRLAIFEAGAPSRVFEVVDKPSADRVIVRELEYNGQFWVENAARRDTLRSIDKGRL